MKVNYCGGAAQERMERNGWRLVIRDSYNETEEQLYERLSKKYDDVRIYWCGTMIPGIHDIFAMVKNRKRNCN